MPRANVPPGKSPKRSASSASSWRMPNFSCWATSGRPRPRSCRAAASSAPTPRAASGAPPSTASGTLLKLASLQLAELVRCRVPAPQLRGIALLGAALTRLALDAQGEPERLGARRRHLVEALDECARVVHAALLVADLAKLQQRARLVGFHLERALEKFVGVRGVLQA